jgi:putative flippase GtrA
MNLGKYQKIYDKLVNRETINYIIAGVLTTLVNFVSYEGLYRIGVSIFVGGDNQKDSISLTANTIAWFIAVTFAYLVNKHNVFLSKSDTVKEEVTKVTKFFGARLVTLGVEQSGMYIFSVRLAFNRLMVKGVFAVFVIIINYILSKLYIFNKKKL